MKNQLSLVVALAALSNAARTPQCNRDNCLRAVVASNFPSRPTSADCSSFLHVTSTATITQVVSSSSSSRLPSLSIFTPSGSNPSTTTTPTITSGASTAPTSKKPLPPTLQTSLTTSSSTVAPNGVVVPDFDVPVLIGEPFKAVRRADTPGGLPPYVTGKCDEERYSSACSCIGITASTSTATEVVTVTESVPPTSASATQSPTQVVVFEEEDVRLENLAIESQRTIFRRDGPLGRNNTFVDFLETNEPDQFDFVAGNFSAVVLAGQPNVDFFIERLDGDGDDLRMFTKSTIVEDLRLYAVAATADDVSKLVLPWTFVPLPEQPEDAPDLVRCRVLGVVGSAEAEVECINERSEEFVFFVVDQQGDDEVLFVTADEDLAGQEYVKLVFKLQRDVVPE